MKKKEIRTEVNGIGNRKVVERIKEARNWYFKMANKIDKTLVSWSRQK